MEGWVSRKVREGLPDYLARVIVSKGITKRGQRRVRTWNSIFIASLALRCPWLVELHLIYVELSQEKRENARLRQSCPNEVQLKGNKQQTRPYIFKIPYARVNIQTLSCIPFRGKLWNNSLFLYFLLMKELNYIFFLASLSLLLMRDKLYPSRIPFSIKLWENFLLSVFPSYARIKLYLLYFTLFTWLNLQQLWLICIPSFPWLELF